LQLEAVQLARAVGGGADVVRARGALLVDRALVAADDARAGRNGDGGCVGAGGGAVDAAGEHVVDAAAVDGQALVVAEGEGAVGGLVGGEGLEDDVVACDDGIGGGLGDIEVDRRGEGEAAVDAGGQVARDARVGGVEAGIVPAGDQGAGGQVHS